MHRTALGLFLLCITTAASPAANLDELTLSDCYGKRQKLADLRGEQFTVFAFLGTECPLAKLYGPRMSELARRFASKDVAFVGVNSNVQDTLTEVVRYANRSGITFPMLMDTRQQLADMLEATRTPEVVLVDSTGKVRYRGRIDDQYAISVARLQPKDEDLANAITALLDGKEPKVARTEPIGCLIYRPGKIAPKGNITYSKHIAPIFNKACLECHRSGELAPFPLRTYEDTVGWADTIAEVISEGRMPPWNASPKHGHFRNDPSLSEQEKQTILTWVRNGTPEGDKADLPTPPALTDGWRIEKPNHVFHMPTTFNVPATGVVDYKRFVLDPKFDEDVFVNAVEARPGNPEVVHHIVIYMVFPGQRRRSLNRMLIGYAPGTSPLVYPADAGMRIPKGTKFVFEMHYTPNGRAATDKSYFGIKTVDRSEVKREVIGSQASTQIFIPPHDDDYKVVAIQPIRRDLNLLTLTPHMHLRGKSFTYKLRYPDGRVDTLLDVPRYDFNWQLRYELSAPLHVPAGSKMICTASYDNSENNPNNPDPTKLVKWGDQSWEEMMIGFYTAYRPIDED